MHGAASAPRPLARGRCRTVCGGAGALCLRASGPPRPRAQWADLVAQLTARYPDAAARVLVDILNEPDSFQLQWQAQDGAGLPGAGDLYLAAMDAVYAVNSGARPAPPRRRRAPLRLAAPCAPAAAEGPEQFSSFAADRF